MAVPRKPARIGVWVGALLVASVVVGPARARAGEESAGEPVAVVDDPYFDTDLAGPEVADPFEPVNRPIFGLNMAIDRVLVDPLARFYGWVAPDPVQRAVRGVFANLNSPVVFVNELLQLEPVRAGQTLGRFVLNSTLGVAGAFDPAAELGWEEHHADFGQTLGTFGVPPGVYHVLPMLGPSTTRDAVGAFVDLFLRIDTWILPLPGQLMLGGSFGISEREDRREELDELRKSSLDFYAAVRSAYLQNREKLVREARAR